MVFPGQKTPANDDSNRFRTVAPILVHHYFFKSLKRLAPRRGLEPLTFRLTAERSTIELPGKTIILQSYTVAAASPTRCLHHQLRKARIPRPWNWEQAARGKIAAAIAGG